MLQIAKGHGHQSCHAKEMVNAHLRLVCDIHFCGACLRHPDWHPDLAAIDALEDELRRRSIVHDYRCESCAVQRMKPVPNHEPRSATGLLCEVISRRVARRPPREALGAAADPVVGPPRRL